MCNNYIPGKQNGDATTDFWRLERDEGIHREQHNESKISKI